MVLMQFMDNEKIPSVVLVQPDDKNSHSWVLSVPPEISTSISGVNLAEYLLSRRRSIYHIVDEVICE